MDLAPRTGLWICPFSGKLVNVVEDRDTPLFQSLKARPRVPHNMSVLFWNSRGISRPEFKTNFSHLLDTHNPDIAVLVETRTCRQKTSTLIKAFPLTAWYLVEPVGYVGGILIMWNPERVWIHIIGESAQGVHGLVEVRDPSSSFILSSIYASPSYDIRKYLWNELKVMALNVTLPWVAVGDFNQVVCQMEKFGGHRINRVKAEEFAVTMHDCNLIDPSFNGPKYTWTNKRKVNPILERLDRGWANPLWFEKYPNSSLWYLTRITSDHSPILIQLDKPIPPLGSKSFRFDPMWLLHESFPQFLAHEWPRLPPVHCMISRLENLSIALEGWNKSVFGNVYMRKKRILARLKGIQTYISMNNFSRYHLTLEEELQGDNWWVSLSKKKHYG